MHKSRKRNYSPFMMIMKCFFCCCLMQNSVSGPHPCVPSPCENGATCSSDGNSYSCSCRIGWMGKNCQGIFRDNSIAPRFELLQVLNNTYQMKESAIHKEKIQLFQFTSSDQSFKRTRQDFRRMDEALLVLLIIIH